MHRSLLNIEGFTLLKRNKGGKLLHLYTEYYILRIIELVVGLNITSQVYNRSLMMNNIRESFTILCLYEIVYTNLDFKRFLVEITNKRNRK